MSIRRATWSTGRMRVRGLRDFHEAAWVFKREDWYYLIYSDNKKPGNLYRYAMSRNPIGPWKHKGIFLDPVGCETTHGSIMEFKGQLYLFYHNQEVSGQGNLRSICVDNVYFNSDRTIRKVIQTKEGSRAELRFSYSLMEDLAKVRLIVNGKDELLINLLSTGSLDNYSNKAFITVLFKDGEENSVRIEGAMGAPHIRSLSVKLIDCKL